MKPAIFIALLLIGANAQAQDTVRFSTIHFFGGVQTAIPSSEFREVINNSFGNLGYVTPLVISATALTWGLS